MSKKSFFFLLLVFLVQILIIVPFFHKGFFPSHDDVQVVRVFEIYQSLKFGDFPPRWSANLLYGYGYPLFLFYSPFSYLIGAFFVFLGFNFLVSTKMVFILAFFIGSLGMYFLVKEWWGEIPALISAVAFSYAPYRAVDVYVRGNLAEFFSFSLLPVILWLNWRVLEKEKKEVWILLFSLGLSVLVLSHNLTCFLFSFFLLVFNLFYIFSHPKKIWKRNFLGLVGIVLLSLMISAFYWIPLIYEIRFVGVGKFVSNPAYNYYFLTVAKIWDSPWEFGGFIEKNSMSLQLGKLIIIFSFLSLILNSIFKLKFRKLVYFLLAMMGFSTFMELKISSFIWKTLPFLAYLQFPWRFHVLSTLIGSILFGVCFYFFQEWMRMKKPRKTISFIFYSLLLVFLFLVIWGNWRYFRPRIYWNAPAVSETTTWDDEYLPKWVKNKPKNYADKKAQFITGSGLIKEINWGYLEKKMVVQADKGSIVEIAHVYYPGWESFVGEKRVSIDYQNDNGLMRILVPRGESQIVFRFTRTPLRKISEIISLLGITIWFLFFVRQIFSKKIKIC